VNTPLAEEVGSAVDRGNPESALVRPAEPRDGAGVLPVTLAHLTGAFLDLANLLADTDPSDAEGVARIEQLLDSSAAGIQLKAASIAAMVREFESRATAAQAEADRIAAHARGAKSHAGWLREYLLRNLQALGVKRIETATALLVVRESPPAAEVLDEDRLPDVFKRVVYSIDRMELRKALLEGEVVPGARLTRGTYLWMR
jgi:hypothetical protein